jgi:hypothetical protein
MRKSGLGLHLRRWKRAKASRQNGAAEKIVALPKEAAAA